MPEDKKMIPIYITGKKYLVPYGLTIMKAMEYAGYRYIRGCGCRGGFLLTEWVFTYTIYA